MNQIELEEYHEYSFDAFCKKAIRNFAVDAKRIYWKKTTVTSDEDLLASYVKSLMTEDTYALNNYEKIYYVNGLKVVVTNETVGEALKFIMPNKRAVLLLSFFMDYRDSEIARTLRITNSTVSYRKKQALKQLKVLLEGKIDE
ncbi:MAG: hypothetical protein J6B70_04785 [Oscillospiraceae bacterium]|nr:hypothetical protein [Oscillospiraceae bacterium]